MLLLFGLSALLLTSAVWKRGFKWWETTIIYALCYMGLLAAATIFMFLSSL